MTLLIDRIMNSDLPFKPINTMDRDDALKVIEWTIDIMRNGAPVFLIDNVADFHEEALVDEALFFDVHPIQCAVPDSAFWMEWRDTYNNPGDRVGVCTQAIQDDNGGWRLTMLRFDVFGNDTGHIYGPTSIVNLPLAADGSFGRDQSRMLRWLGGGRDQLNVVDNLASHSMQVCLLALTFLNCKNVAVTDNEGKHASRQERRAAERRNDPPLVTYKTLQIEPMKKVLATEGDIATNGLAKALHICRGHFAEYGGESGKGKLFGKYEGRFYIPAHVRGSADVGVVHKRYNVKAPKGRAA